METNIKNADNEKDASSVIIGKIISIGGILQREGNRLLSPYRLNQQQFSILFEIAKAKEVRQKNIINRLLLEKAHVSKVVKKLEIMGLIKILPLNEDKRSELLSVTEKGEKIISECRKIFNEWRKEKLKQFTKEELSQILESIDKLQKTFMNN